MLYLYSTRLYEIVWVHICITSNFSVESILHLSSHKSNRMNLFLEQKEKITLQVYRRKRSATTVILHIIKPYMRQWWSPFDHTDTCHFRPLLLYYHIRPSSDKIPPTERKDFNTLKFFICETSCKLYSTVECLHMTNFTCSFKIKN